MSLYASKVVALPQSALKFLVQQIDSDDCLREYQTAGGLLSNLEYAWLANGPRLEVVNTKNGDKIGAWIFGSVLKDLDSEVVCVGEVARPHGRPPLLIVAVDCALNGSTICVFDFISSKVVRAVQVVDKVTSLHVVDSGFEVLALPGPLRNFDGIVAIGTTLGNVFLLDICRQACDEALTTGGLMEVRDELNSCQLSLITPRDMSNIEMHKEHAVRAGQHLAIYLNAIYDQSTPHFILKGPKGEDRLHVNKKEVTVSALHYCPQLGSLLVGFNFGAFQIYNLITMELIFTSPVCEEHIPISHFTIQEPADDPRAFCYIWAMYSDQFHATCLPLAVMYTCCYISKEYHEGYGYLYEDFQYCNVNYQMELGAVAAPNKIKKKVRGGNCLRLNSILRSLRGGNADMAEDNSTLCFFAWNVTLVDTTVEAYAAVFDLNQWYKAQMPAQPDPEFEFASTFMIQLCVSDAVPRRALALDVQLNKSSIQQFMGTQRLEEHFCPDSLSFGLCCLRETDVAFLQNNGVQKTLLNEIEAGGPLCLIEPSEIYPKIIKLGLVPLFIDVHPDSEVSVNHQREIILGTALEHQLVGWICKCASDWANGSFYVAGCSLDLLICWAFQRAQTLKTHCDRFCMPLFDYSETRLDANTNALLNNCVRQIKHICSFYCYVTRKLLMFVSNPELVEEQHNSLQMVCMYYEVLQWFLNVGLLPECPLAAYPRSDEFDRINAPYPAHVLNTFYNHRRAILKIANQNEFSSSQSVLFIDNLIEKECGGRILQEQWEKDEGNGLYPPPSLQALLRTYLVNGTELCYRHSVIIYVLLDLAMTLDAERYQPVITNLIKFPAVFKVSPSIIKITQAFWQLDHEDYNSAMGLLLDPMILADDLKHWHHRVVLRTLLLQKEFSTALLYFQVRKPPVVDDEDIFTAITLYITNNMLDEAFYFEKHFTNRRDRNKFLLHLFRECNKNSKIRSIIYRTFTSKEESLFLRFLSDCKQEQTDDLIIYYHMLKLHFFEAFDYYENMRSNNVENRGLLGQDKAGFRDQIIHHMKSELPQVSRQVLDYCQAEKSNIWKSVDKPKPLSVFVHNLSENMEYKSSLIRAALAKSRQTYNVNAQRSFATEKTPFLRTPLVMNMVEKSPRIVVNPRIVDVGEVGGETCGPPPAKRIKLSPRPPATPTMPTTLPAKLETPIVKRQSPNRSSGTEKFNIRTPQSILKVKKLIDDGSGMDLGFADDMNSFEQLQYTPVTSLKNKGSQSPGSRTPSVRFKGLMSSSDSSNLSLTSNAGEQKEPLSEEDQFYSPEKMEEEQNDQDENVTFSAYNPDVEMATTPTVGVPVLRPRSSTKLELRSSSSAQYSLIDLTSPAQKSSQQSAEPSRVLEDDDEDSAVNIEAPSRVSEASAALPTEEGSKLTEPRAFSPKGRRSYKRSHSEMTQPTRSSPRLSQASSNISSTTPESSRSSLTGSLSKSDSPNTSKLTKSDSSPAADQTTADTEEPPSLSKEDTPPPRTPRKRKSLCRQVLEYNTFTSSRLNATLDSPTKETEEQTLEEEEEEELLEQSQGRKETIVESSEVVLESKFKYADAEESRKSSLVKKRTVTAIFPSEPIVWDSDLDSSGDFLNTLLSKSNSDLESGSEDSEEEDEETEKENEEAQRRKEEEKQKQMKQEELRLQEEDEQKRKVQEEQRRREKEEQKWREQDEQRLKEYEQRRKVKEEQKLREEEEQRRQEQKERRLKEDEERRKVQEEQKRRDEEEQKRRDEEEQRRKEQEERRLKEEEEQRCKELEEQMRKEQEEQRRKEQEEQRRKEEEDQRRREQAEEDDDDVELIISDEESIPEEPVVQQEIELTMLKPASFGAPHSTLTRENEEDEDEAMDVEDVYANLSGSEEDDGESPAYEDISKRDPEMNVFEISDDLSYTASTSVHKEITMEEESQYYDQSNALETVMEENICHISGSFSTLERNVLDDEDSEDEVVYEQNKHEKKRKAVGDVIEISSSDDDVKNLTSGEDSCYSASSDSPIQFEKNVYDSDDLSVDSSSGSSSGEDSEREPSTETIEIDDTTVSATLKPERGEETEKQIVEEEDKIMMGSIDLTKREKIEPAEQSNDALNTGKESSHPTNRAQIEPVKPIKQSNDAIKTARKGDGSINETKAENLAKQIDDASKTTKESVNSANTDEIKGAKPAKQSDDASKTTKESTDSTNKDEIKGTKPSKQSDEASKQTKESVDSTNKKEIEVVKLAKQSNDAFKTTKESSDTTNKDKVKGAKPAKHSDEASKTMTESVDSTNRKIEAVKPAKQSDDPLETAKESADSINKDKVKEAKPEKQGDGASKTTEESVDSTKRKEIEAVKPAKQSNDDAFKTIKESIDSTKRAEMESLKEDRERNDAFKTAKESVHSTNKEDIETVKATKQNDYTLTIMKEGSVDSTSKEEVEAVKPSKQSDGASKTTKGVDNDGDEEMETESVDSATREDIKGEGVEEITEVTKESVDAINRDELENTFGIISEKVSSQPDETLNVSEETFKEHSIKEKTEKLRTIIENIKNNTLARIIDDFDDSYEENSTMVKNRIQDVEKIEVEDSKPVETKAVETEKCEKIASVAEEATKQEMIETVKDMAVESEETAKAEKQETIETAKDVPAEKEETTKLEVVDTEEGVANKFTHKTKVGIIEKSAEDVVAKSEETKSGKVIKAVLSSDEHKTTDEGNERAEKRKMQTPEPAKTDTPTSIDKRRKAMARRKTKVTDTTADGEEKRIPEEFIRGEGVPGPSGIGALKKDEGETVENDYLGCPTPHFLKRRTTRAVSAEPENLKNFQRDYLDCPTPQFLKRRTTRAASAEPQPLNDSLSSTKRQSSCESPMVQSSKTPGADPLDCETPAFLKRRTRAGSAEAEQSRHSFSLRKRESTEEFLSPKLDSKTPGVDFLETPEFLKQRRVTRAYSAEKESVATPEIDDLGCPTPAFLKRRRASSEEKKAAPSRTLRTRSAGLDVDVSLGKKKPSKTDSPLPLIVEESEGNVKIESRKKKARSTMDDYSSTRRLTRRQKELLEKSFGQAINLEQLNPIVLLNKSAFKGQPDPEEKKVYEITPPSSPSGAKGPARRVRSASQVSDGSNVSETTPTKKGSKKMGEETPPSSSRVLRSRSMSNASSTASSVSNISRTSRTSIRRKVKTLELPEIKEEVDEPHPAKRKARSKK